MYFLPTTRSVRSMDRTLVESQQLDVLFDQMLTQRMQQQEQLSASAGASLSSVDRNGINTPRGIGGVFSSIYAGNNRGAEHGGDNNINNVEVTEYADNCVNAFCEEAQLSWNGKMLYIVIITLN